MQIENVFLINAFTQSPFKGNPAVVCLIDATADELWMKKVNKEFNQPVTAFIQPKQDGSYHLRWFSQTTELKHCGHGTIGCAHILWEQEFLKADETIKFHTYSGLLFANLTESGIQLDFPAYQSKQIEAPQELSSALNVPLTLVEKNQLGYLVEMKDEDMVRSIKPDFKLLDSLTVTGIIVTSKSNSSSFDFVSRYFAPSIGIKEAQVTGSAHCALGPYWSKKLGKNPVMGYQASERGGVIKVKVDGDRVQLISHAVTLLKGNFLR